MPKMNSLDKVIAAVSPRTALNRVYARHKLDVLERMTGGARRVTNSGYGNYGASETKKSLKGWKSSGGSAVEDIHDNLQLLRERSRDLAMGVPLASGAVKTYRTNVVGSGLTPNPKIDADLLHITEKRAEALEKKIAAEFALWAESVNADAERLSSFYEMQQLVFVNWLMSGDVFAIPQMKERPGTPYQLCIQLVEADRVCTPGSYGGYEAEDTKADIIGGVEKSGGQVVAYHIAKNHPLSLRWVSGQEWTRVEAFSEKTGRRNILHIMVRERIGQRRGVPILAPVIESLKQLGRYTDAELVAAVVSGYMSVFIQTEEASAEPPVGEAIPVEKQVDAEDKNTIELGPGTVIDLAPGEKANPVTPGRPNNNFDGFVTAIARHIGAALEIPYELLVKQFTASYSASRAALLEAWKAFSEWRDWMVEKFCQPIYEEWFSEAVAIGRIRAPGYFGDPAIKAAYVKAEWYGPTQGQLDPVKEVEAADERVKFGFSTRAKEAMELTGTDFKDNMKAAVRENAMMKEAMGDEGKA